MIVLPDACNEVRMPECVPPLNAANRVLAWVIICAGQQELPSVFFGTWAVMLMCIDCVLEIISARIDR